MTHTSLRTAQAEIDRLKRGIEQLATGSRTRAAIRVGLRRLLEGKEALAPSMRLGRDNTISSKITSQANGG